MNSLSRTILNVLTRWLAALLALATGISALAQGTAFTYQGDLAQSGRPANGLYDFTFALFNAASGGTQVGSTLTQTGVSVAAGDFSVLLDFGAVFTGSAYWLEVSVRANGGGAFNTLSPRQELTPTPYAITAENLDGLLPASQLTGPLPQGLLTGVYGNALTFTNTGNSFAGNGAGLFNVNASALCGIPCSGFWLLNGNAGTLPGTNFLGTTDNEPLELHVNNTRALRLEPAAGGPNVVGGSAFNLVAPGISATFIGGGYTNTVGSSYSGIGGGQANTIQGNAQWCFIGGGNQNTIQSSANYSTIAGGWNNTVAYNAGAGTIAGGNGNTIQSGAFESTIGGGQGNSIQTNSTWAALGGGLGNVIQPNASFSVIGGGQGNLVQSNADHATIGGGTNNAIQTAAVGATIGGGLSNAIQTNAFASTIAGGHGNSIQTNSSSATIAGGNNNTIAGGVIVGELDASSTGSTISGGNDNQIQSGSFDATISGGRNNLISGNYSTIGGGNINTNLGIFAAIGGGANNLIQSGGQGPTIAGGQGNTIQSNVNYAAIGGGNYNIVSNTGYAASIQGGYYNLAAGLYSSIPGGYYNVAAGSYSFAAGNSAQALNTASFVWSDGSAATASTADDSVTFRASGGYRLFTSSGNVGATLSANATAWGVISDRNGKKNLAPVDCEAVLDTLERLPVQQWNYKWEKDDDTPNIGPMAQDFKHAFYPGRDDKSITTLEFDGVELAAIKGLNQKLEEQLKEKDARLDELTRRLEQVERRLESKTAGR